jgi:hypothetical protein
MLLIAKQRDGISATARAVRQFTAFSARPWAHAKTEFRHAVFFVGRRVNPFYRQSQPAISARYLKEFS